MGFSYFGLLLPTSLDVLYHQTSLAIWPSTPFDVVVGELRANPDNSRAQFVYEKKPLINGQRAVLNF